MCRRTGTKFRHAQLDHQGSIKDKFRKNLTGGLGGDARVLNKGEVGISKTAAIFVDGLEPNLGIYS